MAKTRRASASRRSSRRAASRKTRSSQAGGKRSEWLKKVMHVYKDMKARNPAVKLGDAMKAAAKMK
jgi:hypothetical protein